MVWVTGYIEDFERAKKELGYVEMFDFQKK